VLRFLQASRGYSREYMGFPDNRWKVNGGFNGQALMFYFSFAGQHPKNPPDVLQIQGVPKTHPAQGYPIQSWKGIDRPLGLALHVLSILVLIWLCCLNIRPPCLLRVSVATTGNKAVMVVRPSPSSTRKPRPQRRLCCV